MTRSLIPEKYQDKWASSRDVLTARQIEKYLTKNAVEYDEQTLGGRVAMIGTFTLASIRSTFAAVSLEKSIASEMYEGHYNQYAQDMLTPTSELYGFGPDITYLLLDARTLFGELYDQLAGEDKFRQHIDSQLNLIASCINAYCQNCSGVLVIHTLASAAFDPWGIHGSQCGGLSWAIKVFNERLAEITADNPAVKLLDTDKIQIRVGMDNFIDEKMRHLGKFNISDKAAIAVVDEQMRYYMPLKGRNRKCIVLDLDNTLWGGIVGEDGPSGIALGDTAPGSAFKEFQRTLLAYFNKGIILAANSRNNYDDAMEVIKSHPEQILREEHFGAVRINWSDKASNIIEIAQELNIGLDSMIFFDDDHANRELVRQRLPQVMVPTLPQDPSLYSRTLLEINELDSFSFTAEDRQRGKMYVAERNRREVQGQTTDIEEFLATLETKVIVASVDSYSIARVSQLTQRTNQFNMTTRRYSEADIQAFADSDDKQVFTLKVSDRFGDSGLVGVAIVDSRSGQWHIDSLLMSCRVLGRKIEHGFLWWIATQAAAAGVNEISGEVIFTKKNPPARELYSQMAMEQTAATEESASWRGSVDKMLKLKPSYLEFIENTPEDTAQ